MQQPVDVRDRPQSRGRLGWEGRHPVDLLVMLLLCVGFFLGPLKLLGASWFSYLSADGLALLTLAIVFGGRLAKRQHILAESPLSISLVLFASYCVLELANPNAPFIRSVLGLRSWLLYLGFYFVGFYTLRSVRQVERLYWLLILLGVVTGLYGVYQWQAGPQAFANWSEYYGQYASLAWYAQSGLVFRAFSTFVFPGTFGGNMALIMLLAFSVAASSRTSLPLRIVAALAFVIMGAGIAASGSRGPVALLLLAAAIALTFTPGIWRKLTKGVLAIGLGLLATVVAVVLIGPILSQRFSTIFDPDAFFWKWFGPLSWGVQIAGEHPAGMGMGYTAGVPQFIHSPVFQDMPMTNIDSGYGSAAAELGFVGLALFLYFATKVGLEGFRTWKRLPPGRVRDLFIGPALFAATFPIVSVIFQPQATLPSSIYSWLLIGMLMKAPELQRALNEDQLLRSTVQPGQ